jgi:predicted DNA-binding protein
VRKKISTTIYITIEQAAILRKISERTGITTSHIIREGIDMVSSLYVKKLEVLKQINAADIAAIKKDADRIERRLKDMFE